MSPDATPAAVLPPHLDQMVRAASFVAVVRTQSFSRAAALLGIGRSTCSQHVGELEVALGVKLLERTTRRIRITDEGQLLYERMNVSISAWADAMNDIESRGATPTGHLRVTSPAGIASSLMAPALSAVLAAHDGVTAELLVDDANRDLVAEGIDLAVRAANLNDSRLVAKRLGEMPVCLLGAPQYVDQINGNIEVLQSLPWVGHASNQGAEVTVGDGETHTSIRVRHVARSSTSEGQLALMAAGVGVATVPTPLAASLEAAGALVRSHRWRAAPLPLYAIFPTRRLMPARTRVLLEALSAQLSESSA